MVASGKIITKSTVPRLESPVKPNADDQTILRKVVDYYHETLKRSPEALQYLERRGIVNEEALQMFHMNCTR
ncbi:MAG: hypothetical protein JW795_06545 [Chitinivibrionales bacterium]|nr:hypothetical protein [Chitinivibrionales bacterium]